MQWPSVSIDKVWHVGTMSPGSKGRHSLEGAGLSVSQHPYEWVLIAQLGGLPLWSLVKKGSRFLDYHAMSKKQRAALAEWGVAKGYVELVTAYELSWDDSGGGLSDSEHATERRMSLYATAKEARDESGELHRPRIKAVPALKPTAKMKSRIYVETDLIDAPQHLSTLFAEEELGWDGVWWLDDLDVEALSAPRGVIVPSKVAEWKVKLEEEEVNDELELGEDEEGEENPPRKGELFDFPEFHELSVNAVRVVRADDFYDTHNYDVFIVTGDEETFVGKMFRDDDPTPNAWRRLVSGSGGSKPLAEWNKKDAARRMVELYFDEYGTAKNPIDANVRVHASGKPLIMPVKWDGAPVQEVDAKPKGFWYACGTEWIDWVNREMPSWRSQLAHLYQVILSPKAKMLYVSSIAKCDAFDREYRVPRKPMGWMYIDWVRVAKDYDGIEICPYFWQRRGGVNWYYTWDVASGCIWNTEIIADLVPIKERL